MISEDLSKYVTALDILFPSAAGPARCMLGSRETAFDTEEYDEINSAISGLRWIEYYREYKWPDQTILSYMSDEAVCYYAPSYFIAGLTNDSIAQFLIINMASRRRILELMAGWSRPQKDVLCGFLIRCWATLPVLRDDCLCILRGVGRGITTEDCEAGQAPDAPSPR